MGNIEETVNLGTFNLIDGQNGTNGTNGVNGQGIDHISLTGTNGTTKTYTIWGDVEETVNLGTFNLIDGQNGADGADGSLESATTVKLNHTTTPTEETGKGIIYAKSDDKLYVMPSDGVERLIAIIPSGKSCLINDFIALEFLKWEVA